MDQYFLSHIFFAFTPKYIVDTKRLPEEKKKLMFLWKWVKSDPIPE